MQSYHNSSRSCSGSNYDSCSHKMESHTGLLLSASIGGTLGELSGYYAGYLGRRIAMSEYMVGYDKIASWMRRYNVWAIFFLAFQPLLPFDIGGLIAGASRMPMYRFLPPL
jgi:membrane protein YqaA with SNARE-associated domain